MLEFLKINFAMLLEGMSVPFPGIIFLFSWSNIYEPTISESLYISLFLAGSYTIGSSIPYLIGEKLKYKFSALFGKNINKAFERSQNFLNKYGLFAIVFSRFFGWGNYISYIAGAMKINKKKFFLLTFIGIYPWTFSVIFLGEKFKDRLRFITSSINNINNYIYIIVIIIILLFIFLKYRTYLRLKR